MTRSSVRSRRIYLSRVDGETLTCQGIEGIILKELS